MAKSTDKKMTLFEFDKEYYESGQLVLLFCVWFFGASKNKNNNNNSFFLIIL